MCNNSLRSILPNRKLTLFQTIIILVQLNDLNIKILYRVSLFIASDFLISQLTRT